MLNCRIHCGIASHVFLLGSHQVFSEFYQRLSTANQNVIIPELWNQITRFMLCGGERVSNGNAKRQWNGVGETESEIYNDNKQKLSEVSLRSS